MQKTSDKDTKLPSSTSAFSFGIGGGASPCGCQGNQGLGALDARPTLAAPRCPIRFCLSGPPLRSHMEHENFLRISHLTLATDQTISWKTTKVYRPNGTMRSVGEKTSKITFCFKKSAIFPHEQAWIVLIFEWFICLFLLFFQSKIVITLRPIIAA